MGTTETHAEACMDVVKQAVDDPAESVAPDGDDGYAESFRIAVNLLRIFENDTYRDLEDILAGRPGVRDAFGIDDDDVPDFSTICVWYQSLTTEVWRLLLRHSAELAGISGHAAIDSTFFERHQASSHYIYRTDYSFEKLKVTFLVDIESQAVIDIHCTTRNTHDTQLGMQVARRNAGDLDILIGDKGYDWQALREFLRENDVRPVIKHREFTSLDKAHNARMDADLYGQRAMAETVNSTIKQRYGSDVTATTWYGEFREMVMKAVVHNLQRAAA